jgi:hypothetical protein
MFRLHLLIKQKMFNGQPAVESTAVVAFAAAASFGVDVRPRQSQ